ncbi:hypothetical protein L596_019384 [Steinernema carpocapsae]|uniref:Secreted protein n=1 Tax=Steinernema carpocapsae TaxID=34508 RepID=A0A4U5MQG0_STECR|nr:hypothetical protein L596_019384 [Steinernema carpocapsae]
MQSAQLISVVLFLCLGIILPSIYGKHVQYHHESICCVVVKSLAKWNYYTLLLSSNCTSGKHAAESIGIQESQAFLLLWTHKCSVRHESHSLHLHDPLWR